MFAKEFASLFFQNFCILASINVLNVLPDHLSAIGASKTYIGLYMNVNSLMLVILAVPLSDHADVFGRKRLILLGYILGLTAAASSFAFSENLTALAFLRVLGSLLFSVAFTIQSAEMFGRLPRERRYSGMAIYGVSGLLANPIASFIGERLAVTVGARWAFAAAAAFILVGLVPALAHRFHERGGGEAGRTSFLALMRRRELYPLSALAFLLGGAYAVITTFIVNQTRERLDIPTISGFFISFSAVAIFIRLFLGQRVERMPARVLAVGGFLLEAVAFVMTYYLSDTRMLIPIGVLYGIGHSVMYPLLSTLYVNSGSDADRLGLNNLFSATNMFGGICMALAMGGIADLAGLPVVFVLMAAFCAAMIPVGILGLRRK